MKCEQKQGKENHRRMMYIKINDEGVMGGQRDEEMGCNTRGKLGEKV